jgi:hypothetical protein
MIHIPTYIHSNDNGIQNKSDNSNTNSGFPHPKINNVSANNTNTLAMIMIIPITNPTALSKSNQFLRKNGITFGLDSMNVLVKLKHLLVDYPI